jgi:hypothetical protein
VGSTALPVAIAADGEVLAEDHILFGVFRPILG